jgi:hypothetical protein
VPCALDADELGDVFEVLTKNVLPRTASTGTVVIPNFKSCSRPAGSLRTSTAVKEIFFFERNSFVLRQLLQPGCVNRTSGSARFSILTAPSCRSGESIKSRRVVMHHVLLGGIGQIRAFANLPDCVRPVAVQCG